VHVFSIFGEDSAILHGRYAGGSLRREIGYASTTNLKRRLLFLNQLSRTLIGHMYLYFMIIVILLMKTKVNLARAIPL
jgi:hypothetical protein